MWDVGCGMWDVDNLKKEKYGFLRFFVMRGQNRAVCYEAPHVASLIEIIPKLVFRNPHP